MARQNAPILINPEGVNQKQTNRELVQLTKQLWDKINKLTEDLESAKKDIRDVKNQACFSIFATPKGQCRITRLYVDSTTFTLTVQYDNVPI